MRMCMGMWVGLRWAGVQVRLNLHGDNLFALACEEGALLREEEVGRRAHGGYRRRRRRKECHELVARWRRGEAAAAGHDSSRHVDGGELKVCAHGHQWGQFVGQG